jgi:hypothetical protein
MPCEMIITAGSCTGFQFYVCISHCKIDMNILEEVDSNQNFFTSLQNNYSQSQLCVLGLIKNIIQALFSTLSLPTALPILSHVSIENIHFLL